MSHAPHGPVDAALWDANDVARFLKVSRSWVYHRAESAEIPCLRIGGLLRFDPAAIRAYASGERGESHTKVLQRDPVLLRRVNGG